MHKFAKYIRRDTNGDVLGIVFKLVIENELN